MAEVGKAVPDALARRFESLTPDQRARLRRRLRQQRGPAAVEIPRRRNAGPAPLSFSQQRMWFLEQLDPGSPAHNGARAVRLTGELDADALRDALAHVVERHESLRTVFVVDGREPRQVPLGDWSLDVPVVDLSALAAEEREGELRRLLREESRASFDLRNDLMLRPRLFRLGVREHVLLLAAHHIAFDAGSYRVLAREVGELYDAALSGRQARLPELTIQYADYAVWQRDRLRGTLLDDLVAYWRAQLDGAPDRLRLPMDRARPAVQGHRGAHRFVLFDGAGTALVELGRREGVTVFMTLLALFDLLLYEFSGQDDVVVGSPIDGRHHVELEGLIGFFTNTLVLRSRLGGNPTFRELLGRVRETALGAFAHQDLPFEKLVESLAVARDPSWNPVFQVNFRGRQAAPEPLALPGVTASEIPVDLGFSRFDLAGDFEIDGDTVRGYLEYDEDLFEPATIDALAARLESLAAAVADAPDDPILILARSARPTGRRKTAGRIPRTAR